MGKEPKRKRSPAGRSWPTGLLVLIVLVRGMEALHQLIG